MFGTCSGKKNLLTTFVTDYIKKRRVTEDMLCNGQ